MRIGAVRAIRRALTAWLLSAALLLLSLTPLSVSAATRISPKENFTPGQTTLTELRAFFQNGAYWNHVSGTEDTPYSVTDTPCSPYTGSDGLHLDEGVVCNYFEVPGKVLGGWQCCGFLRLMTYQYFGVSFENWDTSTSLSGMKAGDVLYLTSGGPHYIWVLSVTDNADGTKRITYNDCNGAGRRVHCQIQWDARCTANPATGELELAAIGTWDVYKRYISPGGARTVLPDSNAGTPAPVAYTVTYADGQGKADPAVSVSGDLTLKDCAFRRPGHTFAGWTVRRASDKAWLCDGQWSAGASPDRITRYPAGDKLPASLFAGMAGDAYEIIAAWTENRLTVRYHPNGGRLTGGTFAAEADSGVITRADTGEPATDEWTYTALTGEETPADAGAFGLTRPGYTFVGWASAPHYKNTVTAADVAARLKSRSGEETWYAVWVPNRVEIWYRTDGGTVTAADYQLLTNGRICGRNQASWPLTRLLYNGNASLLTARELGLTRDGYTFAGWTTNGKTPVTEAAIRRMAVVPFRTRIEVIALWREDRSSIRGEAKP